MPISADQLALICGLISTSVGQEHLLYYSYIIVVLGKSKFSSA